MGTFNHPERRAGEYYLTNISAVNFDSLEIPCRKGEYAYTRYGHMIAATERVFPVFVDAKWYLEWIATEKGQHCLYGRTIKTPAGKDELDALREDVAAQLAFDPKPEDLHPFNVTYEETLPTPLKPDLLRRLLEIPGFDGITVEDGVMSVSVSVTRMAPKCPKFTSPKILDVDVEWLTPDAKVKREEAARQVMEYNEWFKVYYAPVQKELMDSVERALYFTTAKETPNE